MTISPYDLFIHDPLGYIGRSANPFEWIIALVGLFTITVVTRILLRALARLHAWKAAGLNGTVEKQIRGNIEAALWNLLFQGIAAAWGITLVLTMPSNIHVPITATTIMNALVITLFELIMAIKLTRMDRRQVRITAEVREREEMGFTGPMPIVGFDAQIAAIRTLLEAALRSQEASEDARKAASEMGNAAVYALSVTQSMKAPHKQNTRKDTAKDGE